MESVVRVWNHNMHYHRLLLRLLDRKGGVACDVGSGDGSFAALLARRFAEVVALDADAAQFRATSDHCSALSNVKVLQADFLHSSLPPGYFDAVTALTVLHHMPFAQAADEAKRILKPGGRLLILGVWTDRATHVDRVLNVASSALNRFLRWRRGPDAMTAPATLERTSWPEARAAASQYLPGARLRRRLLWRYTVVWDKPTRT
jgi:ubiquinone/menaquinone biosynthesis C-methylase UbiE